MALASSAFLSKLWRITLAGFTVDVFLWWLAFTPLSHRSWYAIVRVVTGLGLVGTVSLLAWRGAHSLPRGVLAMLPKTRQTLTWMALIGVATIGSLVMTFAPAISTGPALVASRVLLALLFGAYSVETRVVSRRRRQR